MTNLQSYYNNPSNFLYIFAGDSFIAKLGKKAAYIISKKKANQKKLLNAAVDGDKAKYEAAVKQMAAKFKEFYGMTPANALITLASGGEVAGKNWSKGIYGIGATKEVLVNYSAPGSNTNVAIDANGQFINKQTGGALTTEIVSVGINGKPNCVRYTDASGNVYTANYTKRTGWAAGKFNNKSTGNTYTADGQIATASDSSSIWESLALNFGKLIEWLISLFNTNNGTNVTAITAANTQPTQGDGWVTEETNLWPLVAVAVGTLVASGGLGGFIRSAKKKGKK